MWPYWSNKNYKAIIIVYFNSITVYKTLHKLALLDIILLIQPNFAENISLSPATKSRSKT